MFDIWKSTNRSRTKGCRLRAARAGSWAKMSFPFLSPTLLFFLQIRSSFNQLLGSVEQILTAFLLCKMHFHGNRKGTKTYGEKKTLIKTSTGITPKHPQEVPFSYIIVLIIWKTCFFFPQIQSITVLFKQNKDYFREMFMKPLFYVYSLLTSSWYSIPSKPCFKKILTSFLFNILFDKLGIFFGRGVMVQFLFVL